MSFLGVLKTIWHDVQGVANFAEPFSGLIATIPIAGGPLNVFLGGVRATEQVLPTAGNGAAKKAAVTALVTAAAPGIKPETLSQCIDEYVAELNAMNATLAKLQAALPSTVAAA